MEGRRPKPLHFGSTYLIWDRVSTHFHFLHTAIVPVRRFCSFVATGGTVTEKSFALLSARRAIHSPVVHEAIQQPTRHAHRMLAVLYEKPQVILSCFLLRFAQERSSMKRTMVWMTCVAIFFLAVTETPCSEIAPRDEKKHVIPVMRVPMEIQGKGCVDASDYGVQGDEVFDNTAALQAALDAAHDKGPICYLPPGQYRLNGALVIPPGVTLAGSSGGVPHSEHLIGTVLLAYGERGKPDGIPLITLKPNATVCRLVVHYPEQTFPDIAPYPWTIRGDGEMCQVEDVTLTNPYQALDFGTRWNELHIIRNVFACPLKIGVYIDQCTDIGRLENVHFNPNFWTRMALKPRFSGQNQKLHAYLQQNLVGFKIGKTDWEYITNCFVIFPVIGFYLDDFGHGPGNAVITQSGADITPLAVRVDGVQDHAGVQFVNGQFMGTIIVGEKNRGPVKLANCGFWGVPGTQEHVVKSGPGTLMLTSCHFTGWDHKGEGKPCIRADGGRLVVNGCEFLDGGKRQVVLEKGLKAATITGCLLRGEGGIVNASEGDVQVGFNATR